MAWRTLFKLNNESSQLRQLLLGVNAHINHDLAFAMRDMLRISTASSWWKLQDYLTYNGIVFSLTGDLISAIAKLYNVPELVW